MKLQTVIKINKEKELVKGSRNIQLQGSFPLAIYTPFKIMHIWKIAFGYQEIS